MSQQDLEPLLQFVQESVGSYGGIKDVSRSYGRKSITWRISSTDNWEYYIKRHEHRSHYQAEVRALTEWMPCLKDESWWSVPRVLATSDKLGAVIMTALPGLILEEASVDSNTLTNLYEIAGRFANVLHSSGIDLSAEPMSQTYTSEQLDRYLLPSEPYFDRDTLRWVDSIVRGSDAWEGLAVVPIHCDFSPRNWLTANDSARLGIIDWERARPGYFVEDFQSMIQNHWIDQPHLVDAFFFGYGRWPSEREWLQANQVLLINAVAGVPWSVSHGDSEFEKRNREVVDRLKSVF